MAPERNRTLWRYGDIQSSSSRKPLSPAQRDATCSKAAPPHRLSPPHRLLHCRFLMAVRKELLEILVCPICKATVELKPDGSGLKCVECRRVYPIRDDIPVMLIDEARIED